MDRIRRSVLIAGLAASIMVLGVHRGALAQPPEDDSGPDPAAANMAPVDGSPECTGCAATGRAAAARACRPGTNEAITAAQTASPDDQSIQNPDASDQQAPDQSATDQNAQAPSDQSGNVDYDDAAVQSDQAPPPLPDYEQPPLPDDGYIWTPGYWAWSPDTGYFWVPGAWVMPPYDGALWTPGWWGFHDGIYFFFSGYWGPYIGYYGGINYGFGYTGRGYEGGYWRDHRFQYKPRGEYHPHRQRERVQPCGGVSVIALQLQRPRRSASASRAGRVEGDAAAAACCADVHAAAAAA